MTESLKSSRPSRYRVGVGVGVDPRPSRSRSRSFKTLISVDQLFVCREGEVFPCCNLLKKILSLKIKKDTQSCRFSSEWGFLSISCVLCVRCVCLLIIYFSAVHAKLENSVYLQFKFPV